MASFNLFRRLLGESDRREADRVQAPVGTRMLVVDDSSTIRAVLAKMLIQDGYTVLKAADGESALETARDELPDLIFLDIVLPQMNGFAVLRALRRDERTRKIPIVMISGNLQATEQFYVQRFGADDFMKKPFGRAEVFSRIQALVESGRLPEREPDSVPQPTAFALDDMAHIPDIALPDEDLDEHEAPATAPERKIEVSDADPEAESTDREQLPSEPAEALPGPAEGQPRPTEVQPEPSGLRSGQVATEPPRDAAVSEPGTESEPAGEQRPRQTAASAPSTDSPQTSLWGDIDGESARKA